MLVRIFSYLFIGTIALSIYGLFSIKDKVTNTNYQLSAVVKQLAHENNTIHLLKAEQAYLTSPNRLKKLSALYLELDTIKIGQMTSNPLSFDRKKYAKSNETTSSYFTKTAVKWRYKTITNNKYIKTISNGKVD